MKTLAKLMRTGENEAVRKGAADSLLDRIYGKPAQAHTGADGGPIALGISWLPPSA